MRRQETAAEHEQHGRRQTGNRKSVADGKEINIHDKAGGVQDQGQNKVDQQMHDIPFLI